MSADISKSTVTQPDADAGIGATALTEAQIRDILRLHAAKPKWSLSGSTLADVAEALDIPVSEAADLLRRSESEPKSEPTVRKSGELMNYASLFLSFVGINVAAFLSIGHALAKSIPCGEGGGCDIVQSNAASILFGIPVAYLGLGAYVLLAAISAMRAIRGLGRTMFLGTAALTISGIGALFSFYLQYISLTQIHAMCVWCLTSAITMCLLFLVQAGLAQTEIPKDAHPKSSGTAIIVTFGFILHALLTIGGSSMFFVHSAPNLNGLGLSNDDRLIRLLLTDDSMKLGPDSAPIKVVEFSDLVCPSCRAYYPHVKEVVNNSNGKIQLVLRQRPLKLEDHKMALPAAVIAEYANSKGLGWKFVDAMYDHDIEELQTQEQVMAVAKSVGIDLQDAQKHMNPGDPVWKRVQRDVHTADAIKVTETPTFVIIARGVPPVAALGGELLTKLKEPQYQELINGK